MPNKEATARIKINKLLEAAGWRFFRGRRARPPTSALNPASRSSQPTWTRLATNFEKTSKGFIDFLLLDAKGFPLIVLEAKVGGQEPARRQGAGPQIRPVPELPLRHPLQRQPALLLGPGTRQPLHHHVVPDAGLGDRLPEGHAQPAAPDRRAGRRRLHRADPAPELPIRSGVAERGRAPRLHPGQQAALSCGPIS